MKNEKPGPPERETSEDRFLHEIEELEHPSGWGPKIRMLIVIVVVVAGVAAGVYVSSGKRQGRIATPTKGSGVTIETVAPLRGRLQAPPTRFQWESISGRDHYLFRVTARGEPKPLVERLVRDNKTELTAEEAASIVPGKSYAWEVVARTKEGATLGTGRSSFEL